MSAPNLNSRPATARSLESFGSTGVSWIWMFQSWPKGSGCVTMYWPASWILTGRRPNLKIRPDALAEYPPAADPNPADQDGSLVASAGEFADELRANSGDNLGETGIKKALRTLPRLSPVGIGWRRVGVEPTRPGSSAAPAHPPSPQLAVWTQCGLKWPTSLTSAALDLDGEQRRNPLPEPISSPRSRSADLHRSP